MYKKHKVVMLPTETSSIVKVTETGQLFFAKDIQYVTQKSSYYKELYQIPQHLYILSDEEIKTNMWEKYPIGTWFYSPIRGDVSQLQPKEIGYDPGGWIVIASTDKSLGWSEETKCLPSLPNQMPRPSDSFIKKYCELGGIDEVMVEYEEKECQYSDCARTICDCSHAELIMKVAPDNTITIKEIKDSWNKEEVISLLQEYRLYGPSDIGGFNEWIKQEL